MDASTAKVANHGISKQTACSSSPGGSSERLKALCTLGPLIHALHSPQQHWRPRKEHSGPWRRGMAQRSTGTTTYIVGLERTRAGMCGRQLVTGVWEQEGTSSAWPISPKLTWRRSPVIRSSEMWWRESISLPLRILLNEEVVELVGQQELFHGLDHPPVTVLGAASPQLQSCSSGGNWQSCVLLGRGQWPCKAKHRTPWPCQDGWSGDIQLIWGGPFRQHPWSLMALSFFPY